MFVPFDADERSMDTLSASVAANGRMERKRAGVSHERLGRVGSFMFDGAKVEAFLSDDHQWHLRSAGCEVAGAHLGTATRTLFNPDNSPSTRQLIQDILAWECAGNDGADVAPERDSDWLTAPRRSRDGAG